MEDKIQEWHEIQNRTLIIPKDANFSRLTISKEKLTVTEHTWLFTATKTLLKKEDKIPHLTNLFQYLKGCDSELRRRGLLKKRYSFSPLRILAILKRKISSLEIQNELANQLNADQQILAMVEKIKPDALRVIFSGGLIPPPPPGVNSRNFLLDAHAYLYYNPAEIDLIIEMEKHFYGVFRDQNKLVRKIYECLDLISGAALTFFKEKSGYGKFTDELI